MKITNLIICFLLITSNTAVFAQSQFKNKEEVVEFLEGEWNIDVVTGGFAGFTYYLPSPDYYDSSIHRVVFQPTGVDSLPLLCKAYINDTLYQESMVNVQENPSQIILPRWLLFNMPDNVEINVSFMESEGFYGFSMDTIVLSGNVGSDGYEYGLRRLNTTSSQDLIIDEDRIQVFPNPTNGLIALEGLKYDVEYMVFSTDGKLLQKGLSMNKSLIIRNQGVSILKLKINDRWITKKIIRIE